LTMVETAITWSGSVAWRMPRKNPKMRTASPLIMSSRQQATLPRLPVTYRVVENGSASERFSLFGRALAVAGRFLQNAMVCSVGLRYADGQLNCAERDGEGDHCIDSSDGKRKRSDEVGVETARRLHV